MEGEEPTNLDITINPRRDSKILKILQKYLF